MKVRQLYHYLLISNISTPQVDSDPPMDLGVEDENKRKSLFKIGNRKENDEL